MEGSTPTAMSRSAASWNEAARAALPGNRFTVHSIISTGPASSRRAAASSSSASSSADGPPPSDSSSMLLCYLPSRDGSRTIFKPIVFLVCADNSRECDVRPFRPKGETSYLDTGERREHKVLSAGRSGRGDLPVEAVSARGRELLDCAAINKDTAFT